MLLRDECYDGAYYLAGYVVEFALKAVIAKQTTRHEFPDKKRALESHTHEYAALVRAAGLREELEDAKRTDTAFDDYWTLLTSWSEAARYATADRDRAEQLLRAVSDPKHGVSRWIRRFW